MSWAQQPTSDLVEAPELVYPTPGISRRKLYAIRTEPAYDGDGEVVGVIKNHIEVPGHEATLASSELEDSPGMHAPCIDLDLSAWLLPSSTPGHSHLYIDAEVPWEKYAALLRALADAGLVEEGYAEASIKCGASFVRRPGVTKKVMDANEVAELEAISSIKKTMKTAS
jgi:hypothetical protein